MAHGYSGWTLERLKKERLKIDKAIATAEKRDKKATLAKMAVIAKQNGFELHELMTGSNVKQTTEAKPKSKTKSKPASKTRKTRGKVAPKYCNPGKSSETWTGRGRQPLWVKALLDDGATLEDLKISASADSR